MTPETRQPHLPKEVSAIAPQQHRPSGITLHASEVMRRISSQEPLSTPELEEVFEDIRSAWEDATMHDRPEKLELNIVLREVGKLFPADDWRNPDSCLYNR